MEWGTPFRATGVLDFAGIARRSPILVGGALKKRRDVDGKTPPFPRPVSSTTVSSDVEIFGGQPAPPE
jgi:hypothetical protein